MKYLRKILRKYRKHCRSNTEKTATIFLRQNSPLEEVIKDGIAALTRFLKRQNSFIRCSMLGVRCSTFISFFLNKTGNCFLVQSSYQPLILNILS
jgi:hypothetical protein